MTSSYTADSHGADGGSGICIIQYYVEKSA